MEIEKIKDKIENSIVALATVSLNNKPHAIAVEVNKIKDGKVVITNNYMKKTVENIKTNPNVCLVFWKGEKGWRIEGKSEYYNYGKWLEFVKSLKENKGHPIKGALLIKVEKIEELV
ncbi:MAG: pyridoxamine 5'-phosphate oxidase family protein [Nanoarchaeota archaeon]|nr:pyridoxamine 5'-phosphate oxidase family protein [Nanoarchaeota archaeon]